jgi:hypothetical protein
MHRAIIESISVITLSRAPEFTPAVFICLLENRTNNQEWTIQRNCQHWAQITERSQTKQKHGTEN